MRVIMKSFHTTAAGVEYKPGDVAEFDDAEAARQVEIGGARHVTPEDEAAIASAAEAAAAEAAAAEADAKAKAELEAAAGGKGKK